MGTCREEGERRASFRRKRGGSFSSGLATSMGEDDKMSDIDRKKAEVRARLEAQAAGKKAKKGFMTPERKKKLRLLLRKKATEELKKEQEMKAAERRKVIDERCGKPKSLDGASEDALVKLCEAYYEKVNQLEGEKYDMEKEVELKDYRINELNIAVNDLRGKFIKPTLKKVSKYENKFAKLQKKASEFSIRTQLKTVKKKEFAMDEGEAEKKKPGWALGAKDGEGVAKSGSEGGGLNQGVEEEEANDGEVEAGQGGDDVEPPEAAADDDVEPPPPAEEVDKEAVEEEVGEMADVAA